MHLGWAIVLAFTVACGGQIDPTAVEKTDPAPTAEPARKSSGTTAPTTGCSGTAAPFEEGFENGLGDRFKFTSKSSYSLEYDGPIEGMQSLRVESGASVYMTHAMASACSASVTFTIKASAETIQSGMVLANLDAGSREVSLSMYPGGAGTLGVLQTIRFDSVGSGGGASAPLETTLLPDVPTTISLAVDLTNRLMKVTVVSALSSQPPEVYEEPLMVGFSENPPPAFKTLAIGNGPTGIMGSTGRYVLDSIVVE